MMISTIHSRPHKVCRTGIYTYILFVDMLLVYCLSYKMSVRSKHKSTKLSEYAHISHTIWHQDFFKGFSYSLTYNKDIIWLLFRSVRNSHTSRKINKANMNITFFLKLYSQLKKFRCKHRVIVIGYCVAYKE